MQAAVDLSGRPYVVHDEPALAPYVGAPAGLPDQPDPALLGVVRPRRRGSPCTSACCGRPGPARSPTPTTWSRRSSRRSPGRCGRRSASRTRPARVPEHQGRAVIAPLVGARPASGRCRLSCSTTARATCARPSGRWPGPAPTSTRRPPTSRPPRRADGLVVPGVGAFAACMAGIEALGAGPVIADRVAAGRPVLGICVGMQILFEEGEEHGVVTRGTRAAARPGDPARRAAGAAHGLEHRRGAGRVVPVRRAGAAGPVLLRALVRGARWRPARRARATG